MPAPLLTTITPYWNRPDTLRVWLLALIGSTDPCVRHIIYFVGDLIPSWWRQIPKPDNVIAIATSEPPGASIGYYHNLGAQAAETDWIMKLDVDAIPNARYFSELCRVLAAAGDREWFNCGMMFMSRSSSAANLTIERMPLTEQTYTRIMLSPRSHAHGSYAKPEATNFCCCRRTYLDLGGSDPRFRQWGWEDYQQVYMLEKHFRQDDPLPGLIDISNVTQRCRDEIARPKANALYARNRWLCLLHRWHPPSDTPGYKTMQQSEANRKIVLEHILASRNNNHGN